MKTFKTSASLTALAAMAAIVVLPTVASAQASCKWYATTSLKQQQENERLKCGFEGPAWGSNLKSHMTWCATVPPSVWKQSAQERDQKLAKCEKTSG